MPQRTNLSDIICDYDTEQWIDACHSLNLKFGDKLKITISKTESYESK